MKKNFLSKIENNNLSKISGGVCFTRHCSKCGKDITTNNDDVYAIIVDNGSWTSYDYRCKDCQDENLGYKRLFEEDENSIYKKVDIKN